MIEADYKKNSKLDVLKCNSSIYHDQVYFSFDVISMSLTAVASEARSKYNSA